MILRLLIFSVLTWTLFLNIELLVRCIDGIEVLEWSDQHPSPGSFITIKNPGNVSMRESTTCFRFINSFLTTHQLLLAFKGMTLGIGTSTSKGHSLYHYDSNTMPWYENSDIVTGLFWKVKTTKMKIEQFEFPEWTFQRWNCFCFTMSFQSKKAAIFINGDLVLSTNINVDVIFDKNFFLTYFPSIQSFKSFLILVVLCCQEMSKLC